MVARLGTSSFWPGIETRPDYVDARVLVANTAQQHAVPAGVAFVRFSAEMPFYAAFGANPTATIPSANVVDGTSSTFSPAWVNVQDIGKISLVSRTDGVVTMLFYAP